MSLEQVNRLKERVLSRHKYEKTNLTDILDMVREFSCLGELIGRDFEVRDPKGELLYTIRQKPMSINQFGFLMKEFEVLKRLDYEKEAAVWGGKSGRMPRRPRKS